MFNFFLNLRIKHADNLYGKVFRGGKYGEHFCFFLEKRIRFLLFTLIFFSSNLFLWAQDLTNSHLPGIQTSGNSERILWNKDASQFAVLEGSQINIYDQITLSLLYTFNSDYGNFVSFYFYDEGGYSSSEQLIAITEQNVIIIWEDFYGEPDTIFESEKKDSPLYFAISSDNNYYAAGYEDGTCSIYTKDYTTDSFIETNFEVDPLGVEYITFSRNSTYILTAGKSSAIHVWNLATGQSTATIETESESNTGAFFSYDNNKVFIVMNPYLAGLYDFSGFLWKEFETTSKIKNIMEKDSGKTVAILTEDNIINIYDVTTGTLQGTIPPLSKNILVSYDMDKTFTRILLGYDNGFVQIFQVSRVFMPDFSDASLSFSDDGSWDFTIGEPGEGKMEVYKMTETKTVLRYKNNDSVIIRARGSVLPKPYLAGISVNAGYINYTMLQPFFLGGVVEGFLGFPSPSFPYKYKIEGQVIAGPKFAGAKIYVPLGICLYPFVNDLEFFADLDIGIGLNWLWNVRFGNYCVTSNCFPAFFGGLKVGVNYKSLSVFMEGDYDAAVGFTFSIGAGYTINLKKGGYKKKNKQEDSDNTQEGNSNEGS